MKDDLILEVNNLCKEFGSHQVIRCLSFEIRSGNRVALFAPSGSGKTTLIRILAGLEPPTSGNINLRGPKPVIIFQEPRLFPYLTVEENIWLPFRLHQISPSAEMKREYQQWLEVCELTHCTDQYPYQLSGGMKQKTALIRGLLGRPAFVLMDEPFHSIGPVSKTAIINHIKETNPQMTAIFTTHNLEEIPLLAQSVLFFKANHLSFPANLSVQHFQSLFSESVFHPQAIGSSIAS